MVSIVAIVLFVSPFRFPAVVASTLSDIGSMVVPLSMIIIGCGLAEMKILDIIKDKYSYAVSLLRLLIFPTIMLVILKLLDVDSVLAGSNILITALPAGSLNVVLAERYNCKPEFATQTIIQGTVLMALTLPIILWMINYFM